MLKKLFIIVLSVIALDSANAQYPNPIVQRLSSQEIAECKTPAAVTYNFVDAILQKDFARMRSYMDNETAQLYTDANVKKYSRDGGASSLEELFSTGKLGILGWRPALKNGYEVTIAYVQDEWYYEEDGSRYANFDQVVKDGMIYLPGESEPRVGINIKKVYVTCSPTSEVNHVGFQDITRYGNTNVKVLLEKFNGVWKVTGFK